MPIARSGAGRVGHSQRFPLSIHPSGRYLVDASGRPFLLHGDVCWAIAGQLTDAQVDQYLNNRAAKGFTSILVSAPEYYFTSQTPTYNNVDGIAPFATMSPVDWASSFTAYWDRVDRIINGAKARGMACIVNPAYLGYPNGPEGWQVEIAAESDADLQTYGARLANRYTQGNIIWCLGGDNDPVAAGSSSLFTKQWNIVTGIRSVRTSDIITAHPLADSNADDAYTYWSSGYAGFNLNMIYGWETASPAHYVYDLASQAYARSMPFIGFEFMYEAVPENSPDRARLRRQSYGALLSGACGQLFGNDPLWYFNSPHGDASSQSWVDAMDDVGSSQQVYVKQLFAAFEWWKLVPKTDASLVSSSLSSGTTRLYPALASDGTFALIYVPSSQTVTVVMSVFAASSVRVRLYDPTTGTYSSVGTYANTGSQNIATGGERVIVVDAP